MAILFFGLGLVSLALLSDELRLRESLTKPLGSFGFDIAAVVLGLAGLYVIAAGRTETPFVQVWVPPWAWREYTYPALLGAYLLVAVNMFPHSTLRKYLRKPWLFGVLIWGVAHLLTNGDLISILVFGVISTLVLIKIIKLWIVAPDNPTSKISARGGKSAWIAVGWDIAAILAGVTLWGMTVLFHGLLFGVGLDLSQ